MTNIGAKQANYHPLIRISLLRFFYRLNKLDAFYEKNRDAPAFVSDGLYLAGTGKKGRNYRGKNRGECL